MGGTIPLAARAARPHHNVGSRWSNHNASAHAVARAAGGGCLSPSLILTWALCAACGSGDVLRWDYFPSAQTVTRGGTASYQVRIESKVSIESQVQLTLSGLPASFALTGLPVLLPSTDSDAAFSVAVPADAEVGEYWFSIVANELGHESYALPARLLVVASEEPDFGLEASPEVFTWTSESAKTFQVSVLPLNGFRGTANLSLGAVPAGLALDAPLSPTSLDFTDEQRQSAYFRIRWDGRASRQATMDGEVVVTATSGSLSHSRVIELHWPTDGSPDFVLELEPAETSFELPSTIETFTYTVRPHNGFSGTVTVALTDPPSGFIVTKGPDPATLEVGPLDSDYDIGTFFVYFDGTPGPPAVLTLTATSGSLTREATGTLNRPGG